VAFVEVRLVAEAERRVPRFELLRALWKKQTTLPSFAYAGIPYQVLGERSGALALMMAWSRSAMARSGFGISAIFASTSLSPSALPAREPAFSSRARSFIAARSSSVTPWPACSWAPLQSSSQSSWCSFRSFDDLSEAIERVEPRA
jgi:hypothetical protein